MKSRGFVMLLILFTFILIMTFFFGDGGILEIIKTRSQIDDLKKNITELEKQKELLIKDIKELETNPMALEKKAREKLWLMKKNEKVVVIVKDKNAKTEAPALEKSVYKTEEPKKDTPTDPPVETPQK